ncbi:uncharacterized protein LOC133929381 [Phragmites australis]|uniref:uncharacterized protein LOC133929381 n=1 Tax=Phragmites australis TaxID=29695 RepID=UPI002D7754A9|nr:uncharacterized protein LOC133929381 [Phragmites australis]
MGNSLPLPCVCHDASEAGTIAGAKKRRRRRKKLACRDVVPVDTLEDGDGEVVAVEEDRVKEARPGCRVEPAGYGEDGGVRVKIVMKRKDVAELVLRLERRRTAERKDRMEELNTYLGGGGSVVVMSPCRDAWRPQLASIPEN